MTTSWPHQQRAIDKIAKINETMADWGFMLAHGMGSGKTFTAISLAYRFRAARILIAAPKSVVSVWPFEFEKHLPGIYKVLALDSGSVKKKTERLEQFVSLHTALRQPYVAAVNYESTWRPGPNGAIGLGPDYNHKNRRISDGLLLKLPWDMIIVDEAHRLKSAGSRVSKYFAELGKKIPKRLALTGTPMPNNALCIFGQYRFLNPNIFGKSFHRFKMNYAIMGGFEGREFKKINPTRELEFNAKMFSIMDEVKTKDVVDLPDVMHITREAQLSPKARKLYDTLEKDLVAQIDTGEITVNNALVKLLRLQQLAGGYAQLDDGTNEIIDSAKMDVVDDIFQDLPASEPIVICCVFTNEIARIRALAEKRNKKGEITGRTTGELSGQANDLAEWKAGKLNTLVLQIRSGGLGVDLTRARYCLLFSTGFSLGDYEQFLARQCRPGADLAKKVIYYHIVASNTVDERVAKALQAKKKAINYVVDGLKQKRISSYGGHRKAA